MTAIRWLLPLIVASAAGADALKVEKTNRVGRKIENQHFLADLSLRVKDGKDEDSGTLRGLTYKQFGITLVRDRNRMHWAPNIQRAGAQGYHGIGTWQPVQTFREEQKPDVYIHYREGYLAEYPEVKIEAEYRFFPGVPYFLFWARMTVEKPLDVVLLRNNEMTMDQFFTHVAWPTRDGARRIATFEERHPILEKEPIAYDAPWVAFVNLEKGYGYGFVNLACKATKTVNAALGISDGANNGKYWSRSLIRGSQTSLSRGDQFEERTAFVLFEAAREKPLEPFFVLEKQIRDRFGRGR